MKILKVSIILLIVFVQNILIINAEDLKLESTKIVTSSSTKIYNLKNAPFPCSQNTPKETNDIYVNAYLDDRVAVYIPKGFNLNNPFYYLFYFHGWYNSLNKTLEIDNLRTQVLKSKSNVVLVIPAMAKNVGNSFPGKLVNKYGFDNLLTEVKAKLAEDNNWALADLNKGKIILTAHSGGYRSVVSIIKNTGLKIRAIFLFDGLYGGFDSFLNWISSNSTSYFIALYTHDPLSLAKLKIFKTQLSYNIKENYWANVPTGNIKLPHFLIINTGNSLHYDVVKKGYLAFLLRSF